MQQLFDFFFLPTTDWVKVFVCANFLGHRVEVICIKSVFVYFSVFINIDKLFFFSVNLGQVFDRSLSIFNRNFFTVGRWKLDFSFWYFYLHHRFLYCKTGNFSITKSAFVFNNLQVFLLLCSQICCFHHLKEVLWYNTIYCFFCPIFWSFRAPKITSILNYK